jgi:hypothetical protein
MIDDAQAAGRPPSPQDEALQWLDEVRRQGIRRTRPLLEDLRRCQDACRLLGWTEKYEWFQKELSGYGDADQLPAYRQVEGFYQWVRYYGPQYETDVRDSQPRKVLFRQRIGELMQMAATGKDYEEWVHESGFVVPAHRYLVPNERMQDIAIALGQAVFEFASDSYSALKYGSAITDVWAQYRIQVDRAVSTLGLSNHLDVIEQNLRQHNPQAWQAAAFGCRTLLEMLSEQLWQDPRETYDLLLVPNPRRGPNEPREIHPDVRRDKFANRLGAYLHQKAAHDANRYFVVEQTAYLAGAIRALVSWEARAHVAFTRADINSVALATYFLLGELATKTDLQPVTRYERPPTT